MISIVVPIYNVEKYLSNCILSLVEQTYEDIEIILVNDGSSDRSLAICQEYAKKDSRIHVFSQENGGLSCARNTGISQATGDYIMFVDSDDYLHYQTIETMHQYIEERDADVVACKFKIVTESDFYKYGRQHISLYQVQEFDRDQAFLHLNDIQVIACNKLFKKSLFDNFRFPIGRLHEDEFMFHRIIYETKKVVYINCELYFYLIHANSITTTKNKKRIYDAYDALYDRFLFVLEKKWNTVADASYNRVYEYLTDQYVKNNTDKDIVIFLKEKSRMLYKFRKTHSLQFAYKVFTFSPKFYLLYMKIYSIVCRGNRYLKRKFCINERD